MPGKSSGDTARWQRQLGQIIALAGGTLLVIGALGLMLCAGSGSPAPAFDAAVLAHFAAWRSPDLDRFFLGVTACGSSTVLAPASAAIALVLLWRRRPRDAVFVGLAFAGAYDLSRALKTWVARPRPEIFEFVGAMPASLSYPSAHAAQITAFCLAIVLVTARRALLPAPVLWLAAAALTGAVAVSRLYLQVHYPSDVLAGVVLAAVWVGGLRHVLFGAPRIPPHGPRRPPRSRYRNP